MLGGVGATDLDVDVGVARPLGVKGRIGGVLGVVSCAIAFYELGGLPVLRSLPPPKTVKVNVSG